VLSSSQNSDEMGAGDLKQALHCVCGHVIALHGDGGCGGLTMRGVHCGCNISDAAALEAGIRSFDGSSARLRRYADCL
jgi:hypothetical protein